MTTAALAVPESRTFTTLMAGPCRQCGRNFYVSEQAIAIYRREYPSMPDAAIACDLDICLGCAFGHPFPGEYDLYEAERLTAPTRFAYKILETTWQGYLDTLAIIGEWWASAIAPLTLACTAPWPDYSEHAAELDAPEPAAEAGGWKPEAPKEWNPDAPACEGCGKAIGPTDTLAFAPYCSDYCRAMDKPGVEPPPRMATEEEKAMRLARAVRLLGEPQPVMCEGERDAEGRACCTGDDILCVTYLALDGETCRANWCHDCRLNAAMRGDVLMRIETAA